MVYNHFDPEKAFKSSEGHIITNFHREASSPSRLERFMSFQCNVLGIEQIFGYKTQKIIGTGDAFSAKTSDFLGKVSIKAYGFQKIDPSPQIS